MSSCSRIKTYARIRPFNESEISNELSKYTVVECRDRTNLTFNPSQLRVIAPVARFSTSRGRRSYNQNYEFDAVFGPGSSEDQIYDSVALPLLNSAINGSDASMFAYGATGCGKSHTINAIQNRICKEIFDLKEQLGDKVSFRLTYLQLYNEKIIDLLPQPGSGFKYLDMRDSSDGHRKVFVAGLTEYPLASFEESQQLILRGNKNRFIAATKANSQSSRSHAVLTWHIERHSDDSCSESKFSSLSIIDLAGSERAQSTRNRGERLNEGAKINKSLLALGNCITARSQRRKFVPYRESKLTRLLRFSLEGTCETAMIICVSPSLEHFEETRNSLEYGKRAASIARSGLGKDAIKHNSSNSKQLAAEVQKLSSWRNEVADALCAQLPALSLYIQQNGGIANVHGSEFARAILRCQQNPDYGSENRRITSDAVSSSYVPNIEATSPLKRTLRNITPVNFQESMLRSPQSVKRLHV